MKTITLLFLISLSTYADDTIKIFRLNCGNIQFTETSYFSDTGEYDGKKSQMSVWCYLIKHPKGYLMWDTGLSQNLIGHPATNVIGATESVSTKIEDQLKQIGVSFNDIQLVSFSHFHADHSGNADLFKNSTWILQKKEFDYAIQTPPPIGIDPKNFTSLNEVKKTLIDGDYDVFGDGSVKMFSTPGHTPGHQSLIVHLKNTGHVIFAGDLYHFAASKLYKRIPIFNTSRAETLASMDRISKLAKSKKAKVVIQHEKESEVKFPSLPGSID